MASRKADESKQSKETLLIVYGTETGTGQDIAECLWRDAVSRNIETRIMSLADYNIQVFLDILNIFNLNISIFLFFKHFTSNMNMLIKILHFFQWFFPK